MPQTYRPSRPGRSETKSCFSFDSVLKTRSGIRGLFRGSKQVGRGQPLVPTPAGLYSRRSAVEDRFQVALDVILVDALGQRELLDQEVSRRIQHLALAEAEVLVELEEVEVSQHLGDLEHGSGLDLLHVLAIPPVPSGGIHGDVLLLQDRIDLVDRLLVDQGAQADRADLVDGDEDFHPVFHDLEDVEGLPLAGDVLVLDPHDLADSLPRVDGLVTNLESLHRKALLTRSAIVSQGPT